MKWIRADRSSFLSVFFSMVVALLLAACSGGGGEPAGAGSTATATISGKVTLSGSTAGKPAMMTKAMLSAPKGKPGSKAYKASRKSAPTALNSALLATVPSALAGAEIYLYAADHPEWLCPVATATSDANGDYTLDKLNGARKDAYGSVIQTFAACNGDVYKEGDPIPAGNYTFMAVRAQINDPMTGKKLSDRLIAVQTVVSRFDSSDDIPDIADLSAGVVDPAALPTVTSMFGVKQNTDGTQTWGGVATEVPENAAVQVVFSSAMTRYSVASGLSVTHVKDKTAVDGKWTLSADWTTATFYPAAGVTFTPGDVYEVTVKGADLYSDLEAISNVYGNSLAKTATGKFTAAVKDTREPYVIFVSPTPAQMGAVDVATPIRIGSNIQLDVNGLILDGTVGGVSSLGAMPAVLYVGLDATQGLYIYEFGLGAPLKLATTYKLKVSGGKGLNGVNMTAITADITTVSLADVTAGTVSGVGGTTDTTVLDAQFAVKDLLGKWIRGYSDRNITQVQSMVSPDFYFEESNPDPKSDLNKDGRLSLSEFSNMLVANAFPNWEYCGMTITGDVVGIINIVGPDFADFEFKMVGTSTTNNTSQNCLNSVPTESFYANAQKLNGAWTIVRASIGIDTRASAIVLPNLIDGLSLSQYDTATGATTDIANGGTTELNYDPVSATETRPITYSWQAAPGVSTYVLVRMDANNPEKLKACALPGTATSWVTSQGCVAAGGVNVSTQFGLNPNFAQGAFHVSGGQYYWEVIGLGTATTMSIDTMTAQNILKDITAISALNSYTMAGTYQEITAQVYGVTAGVPATTASTYSVNIGGYDVGAAGQAKIVVNTTNAAATSGFVNVSGNFWKSYPITFGTTLDPITGASYATATVTVDLPKGNSWIDITDCADWIVCPTPLYKGFSITTTGGIPPVVEITSVKDQAGNLITGDQWKYYNAPGATSITVSGNVNDPGITALDLNVGNSTSNAWTWTSVPVTPGVTSGTFTATFEIYNGDNWINVGGGYPDATGNWVWYGDYAGIYTDTGTVYVPNISITGVATASLTNDWGNSSDWDASADTDGIVTVTGKFKTIADGSYYTYSDGGYSNGTLVANVDGTFSLDVTLFTGWNYVSINDANGNWYGANIYTANGKTVVKPTITLVDGLAPSLDPVTNQNVATSAGCFATITGTAKAGDVYVYWSGYDAASGMYYSEYQNLILTGMPDTPIDFNFVVPLVGGPGSYNNVDVYDLNWMWTGVKVTTSGNCAYASPAVTVASVLDSAGTAIALDAVQNVYPAGVSPTVTFSGTATRPGMTVNLSVSACSAENYTATASTAANGSGTYNWSIANIKVYDGWNYVYLTDSAYNWSSYTVTTTNGVIPQSLMSTTVSPAVLITTGSCGSNNWDAGTATMVTITGTTPAPDGTGYYSDALGNQVAFTITGGSFTIPNVVVYDGWNGIYINDNAGNGNSIGVNTTNGVLKPQFVVVTSPSNALGTPLVTGIQTVTGTASDPSGKYMPSVVGATVGVYDSVNFTWTYTYYSSDLLTQSMGSSPITYDAATGNFSFGVDFAAGSYLYVDVYAQDQVTWIQHGVTMYYNDAGATGSSGTFWYYKPGSKASSATNNSVIQSEMLKQRLRMTNRNK